MHDLTPIEEHDGIAVKRDDLFVVPGITRANGGKLRRAMCLLEHAPGIVCYGGRRSNTAAAIAAAAKSLGKKAVFHTANGPETYEMTLADSLGCHIVRHSPGYPTVLKARATKHAKELGYYLGLVELQSIWRQVDSRQVGYATRIVVVCGASITLAGILNGLDILSLSCVSVVGVVVGAPPDEGMLDDFAPKNWRQRVQFVKPREAYDKECTDTLGGLRLDPLYESKAVRYLQNGDLFWVSGIGGKYAT